MIVDIGARSAPWIATVFGIVAAIAAEQAFRYGSQGSTPDRWRGSDAFASFDMDAETNERMARDCSREIAAASQVAATYLAAGAAIEASAASQHGLNALLLAVIGLIVIVPAGVRLVKAKKQTAQIRAWYLRLKWDISRKWMRSQNLGEEDAAFAKEHPKEAAALGKRGDEVPESQ